MLDTCLEEVIEDYCINHPRIGGNPSEGKYFCSFEVFGRKKFPGKFTIYLWVYCQQYSVFKGRLSEGGGCSLPVAITLKKKGDSYEVIGCEVPGDGSAYPRMVKKIFPKYAVDKIFPKNIPEFNQRMRNLEAIAEEKARKYYFE